HQRGVVEAALNRTAAAVESFQHAVRLAPGNVEALYLLARCLIRLGRPDEAERFLTKALQIDPGHLGAGQLSGDLAYDRKDFRLALERYRRLDYSEIADEKLIERVARCEMEAGAPSVAADLLGRRKRLSISGLLTLGRSLGRLGDWHMARRFLERLELSRATPEYRYYLGAACAADGQEQKAEKLLQALFDDADWGQRARTQLGHLRLRQGRYQEAEELYQSAGSDGHVNSSCVDLGRVSLLKGDPVRAQKHFQRALDQTGSADETTACAIEQSARFGLALAETQLGAPSRLTELTGDPELSPYAYEALADKAYEERRYVEAVALYEKAIAHRSSVPTSILARIATGCLHLNRYRQALPHLVELARRRREDVALRHNLALCRYRIGRDHFRNGRWDGARLEWDRAARLLETLEAEQASSVRACEAEAFYRTAEKLVLSEDEDNWQRAGELFEQGAVDFPDDPRWHFGAGLAWARTGDFERSADCFSRANQRKAGNVGFLLGQALSLQETGDGRHSRELLTPLLERPDTGPKDPLEQRLVVAARFAMIVSYVRDQDWRKAADALEPLLEHPLIRSSRRIGPVDIAQALVAYRALAGQRDRAREVADRYLKGQGAIGDLLIGLVQADSGDYEGAARTLGAVYARQKDPQICKVLVSCLLAAAAAKIREEELDDADRLVQQALRYNPTCHDAKRLATALSFGRQMGDLDLSQLDAAIARCREMVQSGGSAQAERTLAVLMHRRAFRMEEKRRTAEKAWSDCIAFWKDHILERASFWTQLAEEYNAGKSRREQVKPEDMQRWQKELPGEFASDHSVLARYYVENRDQEGVKRHLRLIWQWAPDYEPDTDFWAELFKMLDSRIANFLERLLGDMANGETREAVSTILGYYWTGQAAEHNAVAVQGFESAIQLVERAQSLYGEAGVIAVRDQIKEKLLECLREARRARDLIGKARRLAPNESEISERYDTFRSNCSTIESICRQFGIV
ncbi:MAG: tetratricopeptide repeat protein, partial [Planctomycetes bacterium]|nr:tetratricopeptide repeat protein [Planctomycetota bacterium]